MKSLLERAHDAMGDIPVGEELPAGFSGKPNPTVMSSGDTAPAFSEDDVLAELSGELQEATEKAQVMANPTAQVNESWGGW